MKTPWFDEIYYGHQKVLQMNAMNYQQQWLAEHGASKWNFELYEKYLDEYRTPEGRHVTAYENFLACNGTGYPAGMDAAELNISCTPLFDVNYYLESVVSWANAAGYQTARSGGVAWTAETMQDHILNDLRLSLWEHFKTIGLAQELNPSQLFDTHAYLSARADAMNQSVGSEVFTVGDAIAALQDLGINPVQDSCVYGAEHGIEATPVANIPPAAYPGDTSDDPAIPPEGQTPDTPPATATRPGNPAPADPAQPVRPPAEQIPPADNPIEEPEVPGSPPVDENQPGNNQEEDPVQPPADNPGTTEEPPFEPSPEEPGEPDKPDTPAQPEPPLAAIEIDVSETGDYVQDAVRSNGLDITAVYEVGGALTAPLFDARGSANAAGDISFTVKCGELAYNSPVALYGNNIEADIYGADGLPKLEIWANGAASVIGAEISRTPTLNPAGHITGYEGINDWVALRSVGAGETTISLGNGHDIFELFDTSTTCTPATLSKEAQIRIDLGICSDYLEIGDLAVQGGGTQRIEADLGQDWNRDQITIGKVTQGKLILHLDNFELGRSPYYDQEYVTNRHNIAPATFSDAEAARAALLKFGIDTDGDITLNSWIDGTYEKGLKTWSNAAIGVDGTEYVIYANTLLELDPILHEEDNVG